MMSPKPRSCSNVGLLLLSLTFWSVVAYISITVCNMTPQYTIGPPDGSRGFETTDYWVPPPWWGVAFHMIGKRWSNHNDICRSQENFTATRLVTPSKQTVFLYNHVPETGISENSTKTKTFTRTKKIIRLLNQNRRSVFVDVGAGTGSYSLGVSATKKHRVVSIEPLPDNARRLCRGVIESGLRWRNYIVTNALHSSHTDLTLTPDETTSDTYTIKSRISKKKSKQDIISFSILLDDLLKKFNITVAGLRISAMHNPDRILKGGKEFFKKVDVIFVVIEWRWSKTFNGKYICHFLTGRGMVPYSNLDFEKVLNIEDHHEWPSLVTWIRKSTVQ